VGAHSRLHGDHAHRVRDHVVELLGDAQAFLGERPSGLFLTFPFQGTGAGLQLLAV